MENKNKISQIVARLVKEVEILKAKVAELEKIQQQK